MDLGLKGKVAMVAGASRGLGFAVAKALAAEGASVSIASRDEAAICEAAKRLTGPSGDVFAMAADVRTAEDIARWAAATGRRFGGIDLLFTNSGGPPAGAAIAFDDRAWQEAADLLLFSVLRLVRAAVPSMQRRGGGAILVSTSSSVKEPIPNLGLSTVLRASVSALAKTLALELALEKIRVNQIIPGRLDTDRLRQLDEGNAKKAGIEPDEQRKRSIVTIPAGRYGHPDEFGKAAAFLLSDAASYITGATLQIDGGLIRSVL
ncbi:MAG: SDR family oxidoreductase [Vicinamibacterales bacterium]